MEMGDKADTVDTAGLVHGKVHDFLGAKRTRSNVPVDASAVQSQRLSLRATSFPDWNSDILARLPTHTATARVRGADHVWNHKVSCDHRKVGCSTIRATHAEGIRDLCATVRFLPVLPNRDLPHHQLGIHCNHACAYTRTHRYLHIAVGRFHASMHGFRAKCFDRIRTMVFCRP